MRISRLILINWKNFKRVDVELKDRVFIVGPNASGKSNMLDAIRFLRDIARQGGGLQEAVSIRDGLSKIRCIAARKNSDLTIELFINDQENQPIWHYCLTINQTGGGISELRPIVKRELLRNPATKEIFIDRSKSSNESEYQLGFTHLEQASINERFKDFVNFLSEISYLHLIPQLVRDPKSFLKTTRGEDFYGRDFLERIQSLNQKTRKSYLAKIQRALQYALPNLIELNFRQDEMGIPHFEAVFSQWRGKGVKQSEKHFSDGTLRLIGLLWALQDGTRPILLEEPEHSLHSEIIMRLPDIIYQLQRKKSGKRQVFITTHSHEIIDNKSVNPEEILLITTEANEGSKVIPSAQLPEVISYMKAGAPVADLIMGRIAPKNIHQLSLFDD